MARIGYARVSMLDQDLDVQFAKLKAEGCGVIRPEKVSGGSREGRIELATVLEFLRPGDELVFTRLDRLGRETRDVLNLIHECEQRKAFVTVLDPHVPTRGEMGHLVLTVLGMVAQMERHFIRERQREGTERARGEGAYIGGKRRLGRKRIRALHATGDGPAAIARAAGCSRMQVYRVLKGTSRGGRAASRDLVIVSAGRSGGSLTFVCRPPSRRRARRPNPSSERGPDGGHGQRQAPACEPQPVESTGRLVSAFTAGDRPTLASRPR